MMQFHQLEPSRQRILAIAGAVLLASAALFSRTEIARAATPAAPVDFRRDVAPMLERSCGKCHGAGMAMAKLRLDSEAAILKGGVSGPAVVPGHSGASLLIKRISSTLEGPRMPMGGAPLSAHQIAVLRAWIERGNFTAIQPAASAPQPVAMRPAGEPSPVFASKVRPILAARCYGCHASAVHQNGLRLDSLESILKGSDTGKVLNPGHAAESTLVHRIQGDERPRMPYGAPPLTEAQIQVIRQWINAGAPGPDSSTPIAATVPVKHWAYVKPVRPPLPEIADAGWCRNPIDRFILAKLEQEGLKPAPEAGKSTLLRRLYLDLIGLPPTPQQVDAFLADNSPDAYEKVVDQLLASPHYGERWARPWLDLARYADTNGYEKDVRRTAWEYRDWVIRALNSGMSFREFTIDQIAGDMLPNPTQDELIATGFHRNTMLNQEGGVDPEEYYWYSLVDRVNTTASVWLGTTLGCAQCHNHKFDPFPQKDYYRFLAFFANSEYKIGGPSVGRYAVEPQLELPTPEQAVKSQEIRAAITKVEAALETQTPELDAAQTKWESEMATAGQRWEVLDPVNVASAGGATLKALPDHSVLASGKNPEADSYTIEARLKGKPITGFLLEVLPDASLPQGGPGRDADGNFFLSNFDVEIAPARHPEAKQPVAIQSAEADESQAGYEARRLYHKVTSEGEEAAPDKAKDQEKKKQTDVRGWVIDAHPGASYMREAVFVPGQPVAMHGEAILTIHLRHQLRHTERNIGRFRISVTSAADPEFIVKLPARLRPLLAIPAAQRSAEQREDLAKAYRSFAPLLDGQRAQLKKLEKSLDDLHIATAMITREASYAHPSTYLRERGAFLSKGEMVYAGVPSALNPLPPNALPNRLGLAEWLVSDDNPLTARVTVNRFWETLFGHGIVETSEDFGTQGDPPTHPKLLDWLATEFERDGWSQKKILRLMVTSATYRQSSRVSPELLARDPYNKLYARGPRFRVEAEMVHDIALSLGGLLSSKMYGPSVMPYQPKGIWDVPYSSDKWILSKGEDRYRRAIYTFMRRSAPYPSLVTFDAPSREFCTVRRVRTNTPLQALTTLNDPFFVEATRAMARRIVKEARPTPTDRIPYGFRLAVSRTPQPAELNRVLAFYQRELERFRGDPESAAEVIAAKAADAPNAPELAALTVVCSVLMNMDETITKE